MNGKRTLSFAFKVATLACCLVGVLSNLIRTTSIISILSFYTIQSNLFVLVFYTGYFIVLKLNPNVEKTKTYHILKGATIMVIFLTFIVYTISLHSSNFAMDVKTSSSNIFMVSNIFVHFITPVMVFLDYFIFDEKGYFKKIYSIIWYLIPILYLVYVYTYSHFGGQFFSIGGSKKYAYYFLDIDKIGIDGVFNYLSLFSLSYFIVCLLLISIDKALGKRKETQQNL